MNTTNTTTESTTATVRRPGRLRRIAAGVALALVATTGFGAVTASPASAATSVKVCFKFADGSRYANSPVFLYKSTRAGTLYGNPLRSGRTNSTGCATFTSTPSNTMMRAQARRVYGDASIGQAVYEGKSPRIALAGSGQADLGTGIVYLRSCVPGLYENICRYL